jgi:hypothetical protein
MHLGVATRVVAFGALCAAVASIVLAIIALVRTPSGRYHRADPRAPAPSGAQRHELSARATGWQSPDGWWWSPDTPPVVNPTNASEWFSPDHHAFPISTPPHFVNDRPAVRTIAATVVLALTICAATVIAIGIIAINSILANGENGPSTDPGAAPWLVGIVGLAAIAGVVARSVHLNRGRVNVSGVATQWREQFTSHDATTPSSPQ